MEPLLLSVSLMPLGRWRGRPPIGGMRTAELRAPGEGDGGSTAYVAYVAYGAYGAYAAKPAYAALRRSFARIHGRS